MPLTDFNSIVYNFSRSYDDLPVINLPIQIVNPNTASTTFQTASAYANEFDKLLFFPFYGDTSQISEISGISATPFIDDYRYFIDLGDGTISTDLTAEHYYKYPGEYQVTLVVCDSATNFYRSLQQPIVKAFNVIPDKIFLSYMDSNSALNSTFGGPIFVTRFNSYQSWPSVSANGGYTINLSVSGNKSRFVDPATYYSDSYIHLKKFTAFVEEQIDIGAVVINSIKTTNHMIYGKRFASEITDYILYNEPVPGSIFLGTSGTAGFYYYED
jgi:PKD repeat protein